MRYFRIYADKRSLQPRFPGWYSLVRPGIWRYGQIYEALEEGNYLKVELEEEEFMDIISSPCLMVSKDGRKPCRGKSCICRKRIQA